MGHYREEALCDQHPYKMGQKGSVHLWHMRGCVDVDSEERGPYQIANIWILGFPASKMVFFVTALRKKSFSKNMPSLSVVLSPRPKS